ncbi:MAG TPA: hypothetical protein VIL86_17560, partial [Tepidisphaeraceae bacterium]
TWTDYASATKAHANAAGTFDGIGFVLGDGFAGVDLDNSLDGARNVKAWAMDIVTQLSTYWEISPSGAGLKAFARESKLPAGRRVKRIPGGGKVEMYEGGRYFTVMGNHLSGTPAVLEDCTAALAAIHADLFPAVATPAPRRESCAADSDDQAILDRARAAKNAAKFQSLWSGSTQERGGDKSSADLALCNMLAFWTGPDAGRIDSLFRRSGLFRDKWDVRHSGDGRT